jgi:hypothetical protein
VNLETANRWENRDDARPIRPRIRLPVVDSTVAAQPGELSQSSTLQTQRRDLAKDIPFMVPEAPLDDAEANDGFVWEELRKERRRGKAIKPQRPRTSVRFWLLNKWQGQVLSVGQETFKVQLHDAAHPGTIEHAELFINDLPEDGRALLRPGALFYWMIGYRDEGSRQRTRASIVWMRRSVDHRAREVQSSTG